MAQPWHAFACARRGGETGVTADRDKIEFRLFRSSSIFNITLREELFSLPKQNQTMHPYPGFTALVTWVKFRGEKLKATLPLETRSRWDWSYWKHMLINQIVTLKLECTCRSFLDKASYYVRVLLHSLCWHLLRTRKLSTSPQTVKQLYWHSRTKDEISSDTALGHRSHGLLLVGSWGWGEDHVDNRVQEHTCVCACVRARACLCKRGCV